MALVVETGAGIERANTFLTLNAYLAWAEARPHLALSTDDEQTEGFLLAAADAMVAMDSQQQWIGVKTYAETVNVLPWPRTAATRRDTGELLATDYVPSGIIYGQAMLAAEMYAAWVERETAGAGLVVTEESVKVDVIEKTQKFGVHRNPGKLLPPSAYASSRAQFSIFLKNAGGMRIVRG